MAEIKTLAGAKRRIEKLEALLAAEKEAHAKTYEFYTHGLYERVDLGIRIKHAMAMLSGEADV